jgi:hypothetical protein
LTLFLDASSVRCSAQLLHLSCTLMPSTPATFDLASVFLPFNHFIFEVPLCFVHSDRTYPLISYYPGFNFPSRSIILGISVLPGRFVKPAFTDFL